MIIVILQRRPEDRDGMMEAIREVCPKLEKDTHVFSHLTEAKDIIKVEGGLFSKKEKKDVFVVTGTVLGEISGDPITKKIKRWNSDAKIFAFSAGIDNFKKTNRLVGSYEKHKYAKEGYIAVAQVIKSYAGDK